MRDKYRIDTRKCYLIDLMYFLNFEFKGAKDLPKIPSPFYF